MFSDAPISVAPIAAEGLTNYSLVCDSGAFTVTGTDATLVYRVLACDSGSFTVTGTDATLTYTSSGDKAFFMFM